MPPNSERPGEQPANPQGAAGANTSADASASAPAIVVQGKAGPQAPKVVPAAREDIEFMPDTLQAVFQKPPRTAYMIVKGTFRSEERRVGKEC